MKSGGGHVAGTDRRSRGTDAVRDGSEKIRRDVYRDRRHGARATGRADTGPGRFRVCLPVSPDGPLSARRGNVASDVSPTTVAKWLTIKEIIAVKYELCYLNDARRVMSVASPAAGPVGGLILRFLSGAE